MMIPDDCRRSRRLKRSETAARLTAEGFPIKASTLATIATRGDGPPYVRFGRTPLYDFDEALAWASARLSRPARSASEHRVNGDVSKPSR